MRKKGILSDVLLIELSNEHFDNEKLGEKMDFLDYNEHNTFLLMMALIKLIKKIIGDKYSKEALTMIEGTAISFFLTGYSAHREPRMEIDRKTAENILRK